MRAAVLESQPGELIIDEITLTKPEPDEVLIQTSACGLCHSDLHMIDGHLPSPLPAVLGHEAAGVVQAVGENVTEFKPGDRVDVTGVSRGKGYQGVIKRHGFAGGPGGHGSMFHRKPGGIGAAEAPGRVFKGKKLPGQMGNKRVTVQNLTFVDGNAKSEEDGGGAIFVRGGRFKVINSRFLNNVNGTIFVLIEYANRPAADVGRRDEQDVADPGHHERRERVVHHRLRGRCRRRCRSS